MHLVPIPNPRSLSSPTGFYLLFSSVITDNFHYDLATEQLQSFQERGYLLVRGFFVPTETKLMQQWAEEVHDLPRNPSAPWMAYEEVNGEGKNVLCRTENIANSHSGFDSFLRGEPATSALNQLAGEKMLLFKEKINYKLAGSGKYHSRITNKPIQAAHTSYRGFDPHIDANAYTHVKNIKHLTILAAVDETNASNGGLEVVDGSHRVDVPLGSDRCIEPNWVESHPWTACNLEPGTFVCGNRAQWSLLAFIGDMLVFGSYLAHRSGANTSSKDRRAIYATYNCAAEGNLHDQYYDDRQRLWPATHMRQEGMSYEEGRAR